MKRAGVYFFYDKDGIVDSYVPYFVNGLHEVVDYIVVVVNGKLSAEGRKALLECTDDLFVRENIGFDAWAYKDAIEYIGWNQLRKFDELVLTNFTIFGPVYPFRDIFNKMDADPCDFWGMYTGYGDKNQRSWGGLPLPNGRPDYIVSNFLVFKKSVLHSYEFFQLWNSLHEIKSYFESGVYFEFHLTEMLSNSGFIWTAADGSKLRYMFQNPTVNGAAYALTELKIPVLRKKAFYDSNGWLDFCTDIPREVIRYIDKDTKYDSNMIWDNLLRTVNLYDLKNWFNLNRILPSDYSKDVSNQKKIAVFYRACDIGNTEQHIENLMAFPKGTDFYCIIDNEEKQIDLSKLLQPYSSDYHFEYCLIEEQDFLETFFLKYRDLVGDGEYDLFYFVQEKRIENDPRCFSFVEQSFVDSCFQNILPTGEYINNVIRMFEQEPRLGLVVPPPPKNERYYRLVSESWKSCYKNVKSFLEEMEQCVPIEPQKSPLIPYGLTFWVHPKAILPLLKRNWSREDFATENTGKRNMSNTIKHSLSLVAQAQGFYSTTTMNPAYASEELTRMTDTAYTYIDLTLQSVGSKTSLKVATKQFVGILQDTQRKITARDTESFAQELSLAKKSGSIRSFLNKICPIGLWNLFRRIKCFLKKEPYIEPPVKRSAFKAVIRSCMPRFLWDQLRKAKCRENGWVFVDET
ncbi:MAG: hypothetical protein HFF17_14870 [Oscillospiraceae bacterium]|nr:hypothetical protein [Oscillospiraceae bacterium]